MNIRRQIGAIIDASDASIARLVGDVAAANRRAFPSRTARQFTTGGMRRDDAAGGDRVIWLLIALVIVALVAAIVVCADRRSRRSQRAAPSRVSTPVPGPSERGAPLPVILVHGLFGFDRMGIPGARLDYFRGIAKHLETLGCHAHAVKLPRAAVGARARARAVRCDHRAAARARRSDRALDGRTRCALRARASRARVARALAGHGRHAASRNAARRSRDRRSARASRAARSPRSASRSTRSTG